MTIDTLVVLVALALVILWPVHQQLCIRKLRHDIQQLSGGQQNHYRHITTLYRNLPRHPGPDRQPMNGKVWSGTMATLGGSLATGGVIPASSAYRLGEGEGDVFAPSRALRATPADADATLRLARPPALSDIEHVLTQAGRDLTATELARALERKPWDLIAPIDELITAGKIQTVPGHTAGRTAYRLADTLRMPHGMSVLPGVVR